MVDRLSTLWAIQYFFVGSRIPSELKTQILPVSMARHRVRHVSLRVLLDKKYSFVKIITCPRKLYGEW